MIRLLLFALVAAVLSSAIAWLAANPGQIQIVWLGWRVDTSIAILLFSCIVLGLVAAIPLKLLRGFFRLPRIFRRYRVEKRHERALNGLTNSLVALASGDSSAARKHLSTTEKMLGESPAVLLLQAQLARQDGKEETTKAYLEHMLAHKETRLLAAKGLSDYHDRHAEAFLALPHAEAAYKLSPKDIDSFRSLLSLRIQLGMWQEAEQMFSRKAHFIPKAERNRLKALLYISHAQKLYAREELHSALSFSKLAWKYAPEHVATAAFHIRLLARLGEEKSALNVAKQSWKLSPHPKLAEAIDELLVTMDAQLAYSWAKKISNAPNDTSVSNVLLAGQALRNGKWEEAETLLKSVLDREENSRACQLMAELETKHYRNSEAGKRWQSRAENIERSRWACKECSEVVESWSAYCPQCSSFDSIGWTIPELRYHAA